MSRITIDLDEATHARITAMASERNTSVEALVREKVEAMAAEAPATERIEASRQRLRALIDTSTLEAGPRGWTREDLYDR